MVGLAVTAAIIVVTEYYTGIGYRPVRSISQASVTGHGTNVIQGLAVSLEATALPALIIIAGIIVSFKLAGLFGIAIAVTPGERQGQGLFRGPAGQAPRLPGSAVSAKKKPARRRRRRGERNASSDCRRRAKGKIPAARGRASDQARARWVRATPAPGRAAAGAGLPRPAAQARNQLLNRTSPNSGPR